MKSLYNYLLLFIAICVFTSCQKDEITTKTNVDIPPITEVNFVNSTITGVVLDVTGQPIEDANVQLGNIDGYTDQNGIFILKGLIPDKNAAVIIQKSGYIETVKNVHTRSDQATHVTVQLMDKKLAGSISASSGGTIEMSTSNIVFPANAFQYEDGSPYEGTVEVYASYLDPTAQDINELMPGNLLARDAGNQPRLLESYGMLNVELEDQSGTTLELSKPATITADVPLELMDQAPETIPLWYMDIESGLWLEEGTATLIDGKYVGDVKHFTWWNCDDPRAFIYLEGTVAAIRSNYTALDVRLTALSNNRTGVTSTTDQGYFSGFVPMGEVFLLELFNTCGDLLYSSEIGPFSEDTELPTINIADFTEWYVVSGTVTGCNDTPLSQAYVLIRSEDYFNLQTILTDENGNFSVLLPACGDGQITVKALDQINQKTSATIQLDLNSDIDLGVLSACFEDLTGSFSFMFGGELVSGSCFAEQATSPNGGGVTILYLTHNQNSGSVDYVITVYNSDPTQWTGVSWNHPDDQINGTLDTYYKFDVSLDNVNLIEQNDQSSGGLFRMTIKWKVTETISGAFEEDVNFVMEAIIQ